MRSVTPQTTNAWKGAKMGQGARPVVRATLQRTMGRKVPYSSAMSPGGDYDFERERHGKFMNILFGHPHAVRELRNIKRCSWSRSVDRDVAEVTLTLLNTDVVRVGDEDSADFEVPGAFTYNSGDQTDAEARWGSQNHGWNRVVVPDRILRTYEGYGCDPDKAPGHDPNLYQSGTWLVDDVTYSANGDLQIQGRDLGRLLLDAIAFPPIVPFSQYPMEWRTIREEEIEGRVPTGGAWKRPDARATSSNNLYIGKGVTDTPNYVGSSGGVLGHQNIHAIRGAKKDYWLSTGQESQDSFVWWEQEFKTPQDMAGIQIHTIGGPYRVYISLMRNDKWQGKRKIPYKVTTEDVDLEGRIKFVQADVIDRGIPFDITFRRKYRNVQKVRLTFTRLHRLNAGKKYPWRAALRDVKVYTGDYDKLGFGPGTLTRPIGNMRDYSDLVKWVCAWAGFWWPPSDNKIKYSNDPDEDVAFTYAQGDATIPKGRIWGSFQKTGTSPIADIGAEQFDKQPLMDVVTYVKNVTGFNFWIDECGGPIWRMPNLFELGNYVSPHHLLPRRAPQRTTNIVELDEEETLLDYSTRLSSRNARERVFVGNSTGRFGVNIKGYFPPGLNSQLRRLAGWTDAEFMSRREALVAADMIAARQMFDFRRSRATIWGYPAIQIDDQIRIWERVTNESYYHYVVGISSDLDMENGTWFYDLETHWLGEDPSDAWVLDAEVMHESTQNYLNLLGNVD